MATTRAAVAALAGVGLALVLGVAGAVAVYNTKDGQVQGRDTPEFRFPDTPTGAIAILAADGRLASLAAFAVRPAADDGDQGAGGTIVPIPVSADVSGGVGAERLPLDETVSLFGSETLTEELPALLGVSIDRMVVVDPGAAAEALAPISGAEVELPAAVTSGDGSVLADAGSRMLSGAEMAAILSTRDPAVSAADDYAIDVAVWQGVADAVGDGLVTPLALSAETAPSDPVVDDLVGRLTSGPISVRTLRFEPIVSVDINPRGVDALALDRVDVVLVFGHVAPTRVAAPYAGYSFRVVSSYGDDQLPADVDRLSVSYTAVKTILAMEGNVRSVDAAAGDAPDATTIEVASDALIPTAELLVDVFGDVDVRVADTRIAGIDIVVTLGTDYLETLESGAAAPDPDATVGDPDATAGESAGTVGPGEPSATTGDDDTTVEGTS